MHSRILVGLLTIVLVIGSCIGLKPMHAVAQWTNIAPKLLGADVEFGAIAFKDGAAWAGLDQVYVSLDTGKTWTIVDLVLSNGVQVTDIACFDARTAIVTTTYSAYITQDGGATFTSFLQGYDFRSATFGNSASEFALADAVPDQIVSTTDGGVNWNVYSPSVSGMMIRTFADGTLASLSGSDLGDQISISSNFGKTWAEQPSSVDFDCYNFVVDPCNDSTLYVMNEQVYQQSDRSAKLYTSTNRGVSWTTGANQTVPYYSGAMAITQPAFYLGTVANGIIRSIDKGSTWTKIGGPNSSADSRSIVAIDENTLLAISPDDGSIWFTRNSGGSRIHAFFGATPLGVINYFDGTLNTVCGSIDTDVYTAVASCGIMGPVTLLSNAITGSKNFTLTDQRTLPRALGQYDSIHVHYASSGPTLDTAQLHLRYEIDSVFYDTVIILRQNAGAPQSAFSNSVGTLHVLVNNPVDIPIGATVSQQLNIGTLTVDSITFSISYDGSVIDMVPSKAKSLVTARPGWTLSTATISGGLLTVTIVNTTHEKLSDSIYFATARFTAFQSQFKTTTVRFSEINLYTDTSIVVLCTGSEGDYIANIAVDNSGVAVANSASENISVFPNPSLQGGSISLRFSLAAPRWVRVFLTDVLGREVYTHLFGRLNAEVNELPLDVALSAGTYYLRLESDGLITTKKIVVQ